MVKHDEGIFQRAARCETGRPARLSGAPRRFPGGGRQTGRTFPPAKNINQTAYTREERPLATRNELEKFLATVERRAYKQAVYALQDEHSALDVVQEAMIKLTENYGERPAAELPPLFQRILQNAIRDHFRRQKLRNTWQTLLSAFGFGDDDEETDPLDIIAPADGRQPFGTPHENFQQRQMLGVIEAEIKKLPARQREAFLLRYWEDLDISETAAAMGCTEGSVKTHCFRATQTLAAALAAKGIRP